MASSPIRINEATVSELQGLSGIGPKRAEYIEAFRKEVGPILNAFDLATAAGVSVRAAEVMGRDIDWRSDDRGRDINFWPFVITCVASIWLLYNGLSQLAISAFLLPDSLFNLGLLLILLGGVMASADIAWSSYNKVNSETTRLFIPAVAIFATGFLILVSLIALSQFLDFQEKFRLTLENAVIFLVMAIMMIWLMYGPAICIRLLIGRKGTYLENSRLGYDLALIPFALTCCLFLVFFNHSSWLDEIFAIWSIVILTSNGIELTRGRPAFISMLSERDRSRFQFALRHQLARRPAQRSRNRRIGLLVLAAGTCLLISLATRVAGF